MPTDSELAKACAEGDFDSGVTIASRLLERGDDVTVSRLIGLAGGLVTSEGFDVLADALFEARLRKYAKDNA